MTPDMPAMDEKLLPCPFCGCTDVSNNDDGDFEWFECAWCHATSGFDLAPEFEGKPPSFHWNRRASLKAVPEVEVVKWRDITVDDETLSYVINYGGRCRDCADNFGICPGGLPCKPDEARAAIRHVLRAINYGMSHGYLATPQPSPDADGDASGTISEAMVEAALAEWSKPNDKRDSADIMRAALTAAGGADKWLGELLAIIHRDGGQYQATHGVEKAVEDAHSILAAQGEDLGAVKLDGPELWEIVFGVLKGDVPEELTDDVFAKIAAAINSAFPLSSTPMGEMVLVPREQISTDECPTLYFSTLASPQGGR